MRKEIPAQKSYSRLGGGLLDDKDILFKVHVYTYRTDMRPGAGIL